MIFIGFWPTGPNKLCSDFGATPASYSQCQAAFSYVKSYFSQITSVYGPGTWSSLPKGCFVRNLFDNLYANTHSTGSRNAHYGQVCKGSYSLLHLWALAVIDKTLI